MATDNNYNIVLEQGAAFRRTLTYKTDGVATNLTGYKAVMVIARYPGATPLLTLDTGSNGGLTIDPAAEGKINIVIPQDAIDALSFAKAYHQIRLYPESDEAHNSLRPLDGTVTLRKKLG
jgi:hypothetical protein